MELSEGKVRALQPKTARYLVSDGDGLSMDILPSGKKSWIFKYRLDGRQEKVTLGRYPDMSLKAARAARLEKAVEVAAGKSPAQMKKLARAGLTADPTVREFGERYYREQILHRWKNPRQIRRYLDNELFASLGDRRVREITALDVQALVYRKRDNGRVAAAIQLRSVIKQMYDYAVEVGLVTVNPAAMVATRFIGKARKRSRVLSPQEIRLYLTTVYRSNIRRQFKLALHLLLLTMIRKGELLYARWEHMNLEAGEWLIPAENAKMGRAHIVYLSRQAADLLSELKELAGESNLVLPGRGSLTRPFAQNALNKALEGLTFDMDPVTIHDLRRTAATLLTEKGFDKDVIEKALAHERQGIRAVYILAEYSEQRRTMLQWWADHVEALVSGANLVFGRFGT